MIHQQCSVYSMTVAGRDRQRGSPGGVGPTHQSQAERGHHRNPRLHLQSPAGRLLSWRNSSCEWMGSDDLDASWCQTAGDRGSHSGRASAVVQAALLGVHRAWMRRQGHVERGHRIYTSGLQPWWGCLKNGSKKTLHTPTSTCSSFVIILSGNQQDHAIVIYGVVSFLMVISVVSQSPVTYA